MTIRLLAAVLALVLLAGVSPATAQENATDTGVSAQQQETGTQVQEPEQSAPEQQEPAAGLKEIPDTPAREAVPRQTLVSVQHEGDDPVGLRLVYHLKEEFNRSSLFDLTTRNTRKVQIIMHTLAEFGNRPELSSAVSVTWLYSENDTTLKYYLQNEVQLVSGVTVQQVAETIAAKTDEVAAQYSYLFE